MDAVIARTFFKKGIIYASRQFDLSLLHSYLTHRGHLPCIAEPGHIPKGAQDKIADSDSFLALSVIESTDKQTTDGDNT